MSDDLSDYDDLNLILTLSWLTGKRDSPWVVSDEEGMEIVLVHGFSPYDMHEAGQYWYDVWEYLHERYSGCWQTDEFPDDWAHDPAHEADMEILSAIHQWQERWRHKLTEV